MTVSVVLRLVERALASGRLVGEARLVASGETTEIRDADELVAFVRRAERAPESEAQRGREGEEG